MTDRQKAGDKPRYIGNGTVTSFTDGASRGNPGPSACAFVICSGEDLVHEEGSFIGTATNNIAEYHAVIHCLLWLTGTMHGRVEIVSDSELVMRQITGAYSVKQPHLRKLYDDVKHLELSFLSVTYRAVPRDHPGIHRADELCNLALDEALHRI
ncbi:MAG TPA: ribonuclease HI family protein [Methanoregulaceae archaeon]|nr:ribonuclease HI family protein [Methanoregulaceae archaeon]